MPDKNKGATHRVCYTPLGIYRAWSYQWFLEGMHAKPNLCVTIEEAMNKAQKDFEERIAVCYLPARNSPKPTTNEG
jgi:hypothetical protein